MKKCLVSVQCVALLAMSTGCIIVPGYTRHVVHHPPPAPRQPAVLVRTHRQPTPPPVVVVQPQRPVVTPRPVVVVQPRPVTPPPVVVIQQPEPVVPPPVVIVEQSEPAPPPAPVVVVQPKPHVAPPPTVVTVKAREPEVAPEQVKKPNPGNAHGHDKKQNDEADKAKSAKKQKAPPKGVAKKVERGDELPPGQQKD